MSVQLTSKNGKIEESISNSQWAAIIRHTRSFDQSSLIPDWNGAHDGQEWTPLQLEIIANRLESTAELIPLIRELAANGGVVLS